MKKFIIFINFLLIVLIPCTFITTSASEKTKKIDSLKQIKYLNSTLVISNLEKKDADISEEKETEQTSHLEEEEESHDSSKKTDNPSKPSSTNTTSSKTDEIHSPTVTPTQVQVPTPVPTQAPTPVPTPVVTDVLETQVGKMSGYGPDCKGCGGNTAYGYYVGDGTTTYNDRTYGKVRILAGDRKYKFGTIIRIKNSRLGSFNAIVLDRGGDIGLDRKYMFDLLFESEAAAYQYGVSYNTTFEVLRYGF